MPKQSSPPHITLVITNPKQKRERRAMKKQNKTKQNKAWQTHEHGVSFSQNSRSDLLKKTMKLLLQRYYSRPPPPFSTLPPYTRKRQAKIISPRTEWQASAVYYQHFVCLNQTGNTIKGKEHFLFVVFGFRLDSLKRRGELYRYGGVNGK
ncbi:hypothetical protein Dimus_027995 [Dionaea muscipula]